MGVHHSAMTKAKFKVSAEHSKRIDMWLKQEHRNNLQKVKILLFGPNEAGKSTVLKQMKIIYGSEYHSHENRSQFISIVHSNIISNIKLLAQTCFELDESISKEINQISETSSIDKNIASILRRVWSDPRVQDIWKKRLSYQFQDTLSAYMKDIDRISSDEYIPSVEDILHSRVPTSAIVEESVRIDGVEFLISDIGRSEIKKLFHLFDNITALIFVASLAEYDQPIRLNQTLSLFGEVLNSKYFLNVWSIILFLNKTDLFKEKLKTIPIRIDEENNKRYQDFKGPFIDIGNSQIDEEGVDFKEAYDAAREYFLKMFISPKSDSSVYQKERYFHFSCATDSQNMKIVFSAVRDVILKSNLQCFWI